MACGTRLLSFLRRYGSALWLSLRQIAANPQRDRFVEGQHMRCAFCRLRKISKISFFLSVVTIIIVDVTIVIVIIMFYMIIIIVLVVIVVIISSRVFIMGIRMR